MPRKRLETLPDLMDALKRAEAITAGSTVIYCFADGVSVFVIRGLAIVLNASRFEVRGDSGRLWLALDGSELGPNDKSWTALDNSREGIDRDITVRGTYAEALLPSGDVVLIVPVSHGLR